MSPIDIITSETMQALVTHGGSPCVTLYMPTHRTGRETVQDPIRLGNLVDAAEAQLADSVRPATAERILEPARRLERSGTFWHHQEDGLAVFLSHEVQEQFRLPVSFEPLTIVADGFHVKPLWPVVTGNEVFYILALSRNEVRLLWADPFRTGEVDLPADLPTSLAEALWFDDAEKQLQHRGMARVGRGRVVAAFHGHGVPEERGDAKLDRFLRTVDRGLRDIIDRNAPLVLAGVDDLTARFRGVSRHGRIVAEAVSGNPDDLSPRKLHAAAADAMRPVHEATRDADAAAFPAAGALASTDVPSVVTAAMSGRVDALFIPVGVQVWGRVMEKGLDVAVHDDRQTGDRDLLDLAGAATWLAQGRVHAVSPDEVPGGGLVAAMFRY